MRWHFDEPDDRSVSDVRHAFSLYLRRRAAPAEDVGLAEFAFDELLRNALQHAHGPRHVEVSSSGGRPLLAVTDAGDGFTLDQACRDQPQGGLHVLAHAVGPLRVERVEPRGARVCVELPLDLHEPDRCAFSSSTHGLPAPRQAPAGESRTAPAPSIVVAAGDDEVRAQLVRIVSSAGFAVVAAGEGGDVPAGQAATVLDIGDESPGAMRRVDELTDRQRQVLALLAAGLSNSAIADELVITKRAVEKHVTLILERLGLQEDDHHDRRVLAARLYVASRTG